MRKRSKNYRDLNEPYIRLAVAIIKQTQDDYETLCRLQVWLGGRECEIRRIEMQMRDPWWDALCMGNGRVVRDFIVERGNEAARKAKRRWR